MKALAKKENSVFFYVLSFIFRSLCNGYGLLALAVWAVSVWLWYYGFTGHDGGFMMKWFWGNLYSAIPGLVTLVLVLKAMAK